MPPKKEKDEETTEDEVDEKVVDENAPQMFPNLPPEDQDMQLEPVVFGPPAYGSPDPETATNTLLPLTENVMVTAESQLEGEEGGNGDVPAEDRKAGDWKSMIEGTETLEALEELREEYDESGADFSTVEDAFDKRIEELENADDENA